MKKHYEIEFLERKPKKKKTKFGGQPDWFTTPQWPISKETGNPMRFICQIDLKEIGYANDEAEFAYLFMTDEEEYVDGTWEPNGGENAIILQPCANEHVVKNIKQGPTLYRMVKKMFKPKLVPQDFECDVNLKESVDKEIDGDNLEVLNKLGGSPVFIQDEEYPSRDGWRLLIQLDSTNVPFYINFGDAGVGYGFISDNNKCAKFLWQCG
jgi:uncharacterized protein YwqG